MKYLVVKRSVVIDRHKTGVSLEEAFWSGLKEIARAQKTTVSKLVTQIHGARQQGNLSSAIRLFVLEHNRTNAKIGAQFFIQIARRPRRFRFTVFLQFNPCVFDKEATYTLRD